MHGYNFIEPRGLYQSKQSLSNYFQKRYSIGYFFLFLSSNAMIPPNEVMMPPPIFIQLFLDFSTLILLRTSFFLSSSWRTRVVVSTTFISLAKVMAMGFLSSSRFTGVPALRVYILSSGISITGLCALNMLQPARNITIPIILSSLFMLNLSFKPADLFP